MVDLNARVKGSVCAAFHVEITDFCRIEYFKTFSSQDILFSSALHQVFEQLMFVFEEFTSF